MELPSAYAIVIVIIAFVGGALFTQKSKRGLMTYFPNSIQHFARDSGMIKNISNWSYYLLATTLVFFKPELLIQFLSISFNVKTFQYGPTRHFIEVLTSNTKAKPSVHTIDSSLASNNCLVFVHGGYWGSGKVWLYRMVAIGLGKYLGASTIIIVGYPVYPYAGIIDQSQCVVSALQFIGSDARVQAILKENNFFNNVNNDETNNTVNKSHTTMQHGKLILCGHSSGANISAIAMTTNSDHFQNNSKNEMAINQNKSAISLPKIDIFLGLAGVYDINQHYEYEKTKGLHHITTMSAAAGGKETEFWKCSVVETCKRLHLALLQSVSSTASTEEIKVETKNIPVLNSKCVLIHGTEDNIVPHSSSELLETHLHELKPFGADLTTHYIKCDHYAPVLDVLFDKETPFITALKTVAV